MLQVPDDGPPEDELDEELLEEGALTQVPSAPVQLLSGSFLSLDVQHINVLPAQSGKLYPLGHTGTVFGAQILKPASQ